MPFAQFDPNQNRDYPLAQRQSKTRMLEVAGNPYAVHTRFHR